MPAAAAAATAGLWIHLRLAYVTPEDGLRWVCGAPTPSGPVTNLIVAEFRRREWEDGHRGSGGGQAVTARVMTEGVESRHGGGGDEARGWWCTAWGDPRPRQGLLCPGTSVA